MSGFRRANGDWQCQCPNCGKFPPEDGLYMWTVNTDAISLFCGDQCAAEYEDRGGQFVDGDGNTYRLAETAD